MIKDPRRSSVFRRARAAYMDAHPICEWCNRSRSRDLHHCQPIAMGGDLMDSSNWMALCQPCHTYLNKHPMLTMFGA